MESKIYTDEDGKQYLIDKDGNFLRDEHGEKISPQNSERLSKPGEFTHYDSSQGHCGLCGRLSCNGNCFK